MLTMKYRTSQKKNLVILLSLTALFTFNVSGCNDLFGNQATPTPSIPSPTPAPPTATPPPLAATVNGEWITQEEFDTELARYDNAQSALGVEVSDETARKAVLDDLISMELLAQGARLEGFELNEAELASRQKELADQLGGTEQLARWESEHGYGDELFRHALKRAAEAAWMRDKIITDVSSTAEQVHVKQILTYNPEDAIGIKARLDGGEDFNQLAALNDPVTLGELGWIPQGYLLDPKADEAVFATPLGEYSDVIETTAGFHIFFIAERADRPLSPDARLALQERTLQAWLEENRVKSDIVSFP